MRVDAARGHDARTRSRGVVVANPLGQSCDASPAPGRVNEFRLGGDRPLEQSAPPLGIGLVPRLEVGVEDLVHAMTLRLGVTRAETANGSWRARVFMEDGSDQSSSASSCAQEAAAMLAPRRSNAIDVGA
jgi:hypothetical protein